MRAMFGASRGMMMGRSGAAAEFRAAATPVYLVGAGPGPPDLLTVRAVELLRRADVVIYDDLGAQAALEAYGAPAVEGIYVGKRGGRPSITQPDIDALLVQHASQGKVVVRLKGGDPAVFSRVHSEMAALEAAGVPWEIVPGVSSALSAPLFAGFPLTHPALSKSFTVTSAHDTSSMDWRVFSRLDTLVLLMVGASLPEVAAALAQHGKPPETPVVVVRSAGLPQQRIWLGSLGTIVQETEGEQLSPCVVIVGGVAGLSPGYREGQ